MITDEPRAEPTSGPPPRDHATGPIRALTNEARAWIIALLLMLPALIPVAVHFARAQRGGLATSYIYYDMPVYMANARALVEGDRIHWFYANPNDSSTDAPRIYFQPTTLLYAVVWKSTGLAPGLVLSIVGAASAWVCARVAIALFRDAAGSARDGPHRLALIALFWGGGLLAAAGAALAVATHKSPLAFESLVALDPARGLWFLNFGRNLVFPTEAAYHALAFGVLLAVGRRHWIVATLLQLILSACHPFTSIEVALIVACWVGFERGFMKNRDVPRLFIVTACAQIIVILWYYGIYLNSFEAHRRVHAQLALDWGIQARNFVPAYALVAALAFWPMRDARRAAAHLSTPRRRLYLIWFLVAFALANHEFAIRPVQPIHFTRGYIWTPLFLLGVETLLGLFAAIGGLRVKPVRVLAAAALLAVMLSDNAAWFAHIAYDGLLDPASRAWRPPDPAWPRDIRLRPAQRAALDRLNQTDLAGCLLVSRDRLIGYLAIAETPLRSWLGHFLNTPDFEAKSQALDKLFDAGVLDPSWRDRDLVILDDRDEPSAALAKTLEDSAATPVFRDADVRIWNVVARDSRTERNLR